MSGEPHLKKWRIVTNCEKLAINLNSLRWHHEHGFKHAPIEGSKTAGTAYYPRSMCETIASSLYGDIIHAEVPCMPTVVF